MENSAECSAHSLSCGWQGPFIKVWNEKWQKRETQPKGEAFAICIFSRGLTCQVKHLLKLWPGHECVGIKEGVTSHALGVILHLPHGLDSVVPKERRPLHTELFQNS